MVFAIHLGSRGSLRENCKTHAFGPPKNTLGPVFASQNTMKNIFRGSRSRKTLSFTMLLDSKGTVSSAFRLENDVFYWLFEALFGCREIEVFYAHLEPLLGFREKRVFGEKPSFAKVPYFTRFPLLTPFWDLIFLLFAELLG